jgi:hypothetical protein
VCGWDEVFILDLNERKQKRPQKIWTWMAEGRKDLPDEFKPLFKTTDECKPFDQGRKILITSSSGGVAYVDRQLDSVLFYGRAANAHSADLLPNDRIAVAASYDSQGKGDRLVIFDIDLPDQVLWKEKLPWGHGVVWDEKRQLLWALANKDIRVYKLKDWNTDTPSLLRVSIIDLPEGGGHDFYPLPDTSLMFVTTSNHCWLFDRDTKTFFPHPELSQKAHVKSICQHPVTKQIAYIQAEGKNWWAEHIHLLKPEETLYFPEEHFYKARWNIRIK